MAAPFVSGAAAVLWSDRPEATAQQVKEAILRSVIVEKNSSGNPVYRNSTQGRLNLDTALSALRNLVP